MKEAVLKSDGADTSVSLARRKQSAVVVVGIVCYHPPDFSFCLHHWGGLAFCFNSHTMQSFCLHELNHFHRCAVRSLNYPS